MTTMIRMMTTSDRNATIFFKICRAACIYEVRRRHGEYSLNSYFSLGYVSARSYFRFISQIQGSDAGTADVTRMCTSVVLLIFLWPPLH